MTLTTNQAAIITILDGALLKRIPQNKSVEKASSAHKHNSYTLAWEGMGQVNSHISAEYIWSNIFNLEVQYICVTDDERVAVAENFITLVKLLMANSSFDGVIGDTIPFANIDNEHCKGSLKFYWGLDATT